MRIVIVGVTVRSVPIWHTFCETAIGISWPLVAATWTSLRN